MIAFYKIISFQEFSFVLTPPVTLDMYVSSLFCCFFCFCGVYTSLPAHSIPFCSPSFLEHRPRETSSCRFGKR